MGALHPWIQTLTCRPVPLDCAFPRVPAAWARGVAARWTGMAMQFNRCSMDTRNRCAVYCQPRAQKTSPRMLVGQWYLHPAPPTPPNPQNINEKGVRGTIRTREKACVDGASEQASKERHRAADVVFLFLFGFRDAPLIVSRSQSPWTSCWPCNTHESSQSPNVGLQAAENPGGFQHGKIASA